MFLTCVTLILEWGEPLHREEGYLYLNEMEGVE